MNLNKILKTDYEFLPEVAKKIEKESEAKRKEKLDVLGLKDPSSKDLYQALLEKSSEAEKELSLFIGANDCSSEYSLTQMVLAAQRARQPGSGFFLKENKARELLLNNPPEDMVKVLGYSSTEEMIESEDFFEIYGSLRFAESSEWMGKFLETYKDLKKTDFESRQITFRVLSKKRWHDLAQNFIKKKFHNLTHLKELGVIFALPRDVSNCEGVVLSTFSLLLHYINEVSYNGKVFEMMSGDNFGKKIIPLLKGEIKEGKDGWRVIPRYLNKEKEIDPRYYEPHIHPEAIFWARADESLMELAKGLPGSSLDFWSDVDWVGGMVGDELITFNSVDVSLSFANKLPLGKHYTYHFKEALWNKVFALSVGDPENYFLDTWSS